MSRYDKDQLKFIQNNLVDRVVIILHNIICRVHFFLSILINSFIFHFNVFNICFNLNDT